MLCQYQKGQGSDKFKVKFCRKSMDYDCRKSIFQFCHRAIMAVQSRAQDQYSYVQGGR